MHKRRPQLNAGFILDFELGEQALNIQWFNGKPIFRQAFQLTGGNNSSTVATTLNTSLDTLIDGYWAGKTATAWFANAGTITNGIQLAVGDGLLTVDHQTINLTDQLIFCILTYTKL